MPDKETLKQALSCLIAIRDEINEQRLPDYDAHGFGYFEGDELEDGGGIRVSWPNLSVLCKIADELLDKLGVERGGGLVE